MNRCLLCLLTALAVGCKEKTPPRTGPQPNAIRHQKKEAAKNQAPYVKREVGKPSGTLILLTSRRGGAWTARMEIGKKDVKRLNLAGSPSPSPDGAKIAVVAYYNDTSRFEICIMNPDGGGRTRITKSTDFDSHHPAWSPDGKRIAFYRSTRDGGDIWVMNADGSNPRALAPHDAHDEAPTWSPDGTKIAFASTRGKRGGIYVMNADGSGTRRLTSEDFKAYDPAWSPDGSYIAYAAYARDPERKKRLYSLRVIKPDGTGERTLVSGKPMLRRPSWSPKSDWLVFSCKDETTDICMVNVNGENFQNLLEDKPHDDKPSWLNMKP